VFLFDYNRVQLFYPEILSTVIEECTTAKIGCVECKDRIARKVLEKLQPIKERRSYYENHRDEVLDIIRDGSKKAREIASKTMEEVRMVMKMKY
ncbi:MAG: tryptophan--tRNA ligase, partial [Brevinematia bacterium]